MLDAAEVVRHIPVHVPDRAGWATDIIAAIASVPRPPTAERVCAVIAVIEQESGYDPDPAVANLAGVVHEALLKKLAPLGPLASPALAALLAGKAPGSSETFGRRIARLRTERDIDRLFRDVAATYREALPGTYVVASALSRLLGKGALERLNPITTAGSMQVKVPFARTLDVGLSDDEVRERLYTRAGGVRAGAARLLGYGAAYDDIVYRFADYNAGIYSSRNAAFQAMLTELTGEPLALDGDLQAYDESGAVKSLQTKSLHALLTFGRAHDMWDWTVERNVAKEKTIDFEDTSVWNAVRDAWEAKTGKKPPYARLPDIALASPKLSRARTTAWYADAVKQHYKACRARQ